jgi:predicted dehydrogenase
LGAATVIVRGGMADLLRFGILGTGNIARQFVEGMASSRRGVVAAVGSRQSAAADAFARERRLPRAHSSYEALLADPDVDVIYVSLPNSMHHEWTLRALAAGKHVLCEKPLAANARQAEEMFDAAGRAGRVLVEAFMYRSHPLTLAAHDAVRAGEIGTLKLIRTSFCYRTTRVRENIRFDPALAGGALMDVGCYCLNFARYFAGAEPVAAHAVGHLHDTGVDDQVAGVLRFPGGVLASFTCGMTVQADNTAYVCGSEGYIEVPVPWKPLEKAAYSVVRGTPPKMDGPVKTPVAVPRETRQVTAPASLYALEADDFAAAVLDGAPTRIDRADTVGNMRVLDEVRRQVERNAE